MHAAYKHPYAVLISSLSLPASATPSSCIQAAKRLRDTLAWREKERPTEAVCEACRKDPESHYMQIVGFDMFSRPVIYSCFDLANNR